MEETFSLKCNRCDYQAACKKNLVQHLKRKIICPPLTSDVDRDIQIQTLTKKSDNAVSCKYCSKKFNFRSNMYRHLKSCLFYIDPLQNNSNKTKIITSFGNETSHHLSYDYLTSCLKSRNIRGLIENIYFNKECPSNRNITLQSMKNKTVKVYDEGKWNMMCSEEAMDDMIIKAKETLINHYNNNMEADENAIGWLAMINNRLLKKQLMMVLCNNKVSN